LQYSREMPRITGHGLRIALRHYPLLSGGCLLAQRPELAPFVPAHDTTVATLRDGSRIAIRSGDFIGRSIYFTGDYDPKITQICRQVLRPGDTVLDVGANQGIVSAYAAGCVGPTGRVHAVEPQRELTDLITRTVEINRFRQVVVHPVALSDADREAPLFGSADQREEASLEGEGGEVLATVTVRHAGSFLDELDLGPIRLLKLDVEGHEESFLRGALEYLRGNPPDVVVFESHGNAVFDTRPPVALLAELGYTFFQVAKTFVKLRLTPLAGRVASPRGFDFVAIRAGVDVGLL
jgi:FkbM family methyltransferase